MWSAADPTLPTGLMSLDGGAHVFFARTESLAAYACTRVTRNLTADEWVRYLGPDVPYRTTCSGR